MYIEHSYFVEGNTLVDTLLKSAFPMNASTTEQVIVLELSRSGEA